MSTVEAQQQYVALLLKSGEAEPVPAGTTVFAKGDPGDRMYLVKSGTIVLRHRRSRSSSRSARAGCSASSP